MLEKRKNILYFAPHQDDELLTMGIDIVASLQKKYEVKVVLCSDGSKSGVVETLKDGKRCSKHEGAHKYELTQEQFIEARDKEFRDSCLALGVKWYNIHIASNRGVDGELTVENAQEIIKRYVALCVGEVTVCTMSPNNGTEQHCDHKALGRAAENLLSRGVIKTVKFFVEPYHYEQICEDPRAIPVAPYIDKASPIAAERVKSAIDAYSLWKPEEGRYAVGYHSVTTEFNDFLAKKECCYFIKRDPTATGVLQRVEEQHRKWIKVQKQSQYFYSKKRGKMPELGEFELIWIEAGEKEKYKEFCAKCGIQLREKDIERLKDGSSFGALITRESRVAASGWMAYGQRFYIGETDIGFDMAKSKTALMYDFNIRQEYRDKGLFSLLMSAMTSIAKKPERFVAYAEPNATEAMKAIEQAGFKQDGKFKAEDESMQKHLAELGFTKIKRKYKLRGLIVKK